jgi:hypothetical protein
MVLELVLSNYSHLKLIKEVIQVQNFVTTRIVQRGGPDPSFSSADLMRVSTELGNLSGL